MNRKQYVLEAIGQEDRIRDYRGGKLDTTMPVPRPGEDEKESKGMLDTAQDIASLIAFGADFIPGPGTAISTIIDLTNAGIDLAQGQKDQALLNAIAAIPGVGTYAQGTRLASKGIAKTLANMATSTPSKVISGVVPLVVPTGDGNDTPQDSTQDSTQDNTQQNPFQLDPQVVRSAIAGRRGSGGTVTPGTLQTFRRFAKESLEQTSTDIARCIMENRGDIIGRVGDFSKDAAKKLKDAAETAAKKTDGDAITDLGRAAKDRASGFFGTKTGKSLGAAALAAGIFGAPFFVRSMFGQSDTSDPQGQGSQAGSRQGDGGAMGGGRSIIDRLAMMYGYIPGFNPASLAVGALGKRVGAMA